MQKNKWLLASAILCLLYVCVCCAEVENDTADRSLTNGGNNPQIVDGIHIETGLVYDEHFDIVRASCTSCHSSKLITQNRATRDGWKQMITWMQASQGLWDLGENEPIILDYLAKHYAPKEVGRRASLSLQDSDWYVLELEEN